MSVPSYWREIPARYRLEAGKCSKCGEIHFPTRLVCRECGQRTFETVPLSREGTLLSYSEVHEAHPDFATQVPYAVGVVELTEGVRVGCQVADYEADQLRTGLPVRIEFRRISEAGEAGVIHYGYKAVPK